MNNEPTADPAPNVLPYASTLPGFTPESSRARRILSTTRPRSSLVTIPGTAILIAAGSIVVAILSGEMTTCRGATRSAKLQWQQRQQEVDQAIAEQSAPPSDKATGG